MIVTKRFILVALGIVLITPFLCGQNYRTVITSSQGIRLVLNPLDQFSRAFGLRDEKIEEAARKGITGSGFRTNETSDLVISVSIIPLSQQEEDVFPFRIEIHGGTTLEKAAGKEFSPDIIGDIPAVKNITVPWNDEDKILLMVEQLANKVATELRKEIRRRQFNRR